jgi:hypothetical protein
MSKDDPFYAPAAANPFAAFQSEVKQKINMWVRIPSLWLSTHLIMAKSH